MAGRGIESEREGASEMVGEGEPPKEVGWEAVGLLPRERPELGGRRGRPDRGRRARRCNRMGYRGGGGLPRRRWLWRPRRDHGLPCWPPTEIAELGWGE